MSAILNKYLKVMIPVDRTEIEAWGKKFDAKGNFPKLIAKLIMETTPKDTFLQMPSGSAVYMGGWDGIVKCKDNVGLVPEGISLWEIGANGDEAKANSDYNKRTDDSLGFEKNDATYVCITSNVWENKTSWAIEKAAEGVWKDVKAYDSRDIADWLENAPISCRWYSVLTKTYPYDGIYTAEEYWKMLSIGPKGQLPPQIVTAGREQLSKAILEFLSGKPGVKAVKGSTKEEAIAFIIASAMSFEHHARELFFARTVVVDNEHNFHSLRINKNAINLIAKLDTIGKLYVAAYDNGHHVLVPLNPDDSFGPQDIFILPRIDREGQIAALEELGLNSEEAHKYSKEAGRDYTILKNLLGFGSDENKWKLQGKVHEIIPVLLIGRWNESKEGDCKILEKLSGENYISYSEKLYKWLEVESPPIIKIGSTWRLTSPLNAWTHLSGHLSLRDFEILRECFLQVMTEINPILEHTERERQAITLRGKESQYSEWCREGLTQSMILIGLHGDNLQFKHSFSAQKWVDSIIKELLFGAHGKLWASRDPEMPLIAEASPKSFFESAYHSLSLVDKPIMDMFREEDTWLSPTSHHTGLLWALEGLAWTEEYVFEASQLLARLASLDPGGKLSNRPINSLREIFKPWHYQTLASLEDRLRILEQIIKENYETGWELLRGMIPKSPETAFPTSKLRWRLFERSFEPHSTWPEVFETHSRVIDLLIKYLDFSEVRLLDLIEISESAQIQSDERDKILSFIESNLDKIKFKGNLVWDGIRNILSRHRSYPDAPWAIPEVILKRYEVLYKKLEPADLVERVAWMFNDYWPAFAEGFNRIKLSVEEREQLVLKERIEGLKNIYQTCGFECLKGLVKNVQEKFIYGDTLAYIINREVEILSLYEYLKEDDISILKFIQGFTFRKSMINDIDWVFSMFESLEEANYSGPQIAKILYKIEQTKRVWDYISSKSLETQNSYWMGIDPHFWSIPEDDFLYGINRLLEVKRFITALEIAYHKPTKLPTEKLVELLENAATQKLGEDRRFVGSPGTELEFAL